MPRHADDALRRVGDVAHLLRAVRQRVGGGEVDEDAPSPPPRRWGSAALTPSPPTCPRRTPGRRRKARALAARRTAWGGSWAGRSSTTRPGGGPRGRRRSRAWLTVALGSACRPSGRWGRRGEARRAVSASLNRPHRVAHGGRSILATPLQTSPAGWDEGTQRLIEHRSTGPGSTGRGGVPALGLLAASVGRSRTPPAARGTHRLMASARRLTPCAPPRRWLPPGSPLEA